MRHLFCILCSRATHAGSVAPPFDFGRVAASSSRLWLLNARVSEWSKERDSSSRSESCMGSNPIARIFSPDASSPLSSPLSPLFMGASRPKRQRSHKNTTSVPTPQLPKSRITDRVNTIVRHGLGSPTLNVYKRILFVCVPRHLAHLGILADGDVYDNGGSRHHTLKARGRIHIPPVRRWPAAKERRGRWLSRSAAASAGGGCGRRALSLSARGDSPPAAMAGAILGVQEARQWR